MSHPRFRRLLKPLAFTLSFLVVAAAATGWVAFRKLDHNIHTDTAADRTLHDQASARPTVAPKAYHAENVLLIGSDSRAGANAKYGAGLRGSARSDTTILLHLAADRRHATAMSVPRDLMVRVPACTSDTGQHHPAAFEQFNWAYEFGGPACTIRTVENLTGIRINHYVVIDFTGFKKMVNAVGGVQVCLPKAVDDPKSGLHLPAGRQVVTGDQALAYVRARETLGNGSDTERIGRQQAFLSSLVKKVTSTGMLLHPTRLYSLLDAATSAVTTDSGLDSLGRLYDLVSSLRKVPAKQTVFVTVPEEPYPADPNRTQPRQPAAEQLFRTIRDDDPVHLGSGGSPKRQPAGRAASRSASPSASASPTFSGRTADQNICAAD